MARFIKTNDLNNYTIIAHRSPYASALLPFLPGKTFWYADIEDYGTFVRYNKKYFGGKDIPNSEVISRVKTAFPKQSKILLLLSKPLSSPELNRFRLLYKADEAFGYNRENFYLYKAIEKK